MKRLILLYLFSLLFLEACNKEKEDPKTEETPTVCAKDNIKTYAGVYEMREYWPLFDSSGDVTLKYDTNYFDFNITYQVCNTLLITEKSTAFLFDSTLSSSVNTSTTPGWYAYGTLTIINNDSIYYYEEYGHNGRVYKNYVGKRK